MNVFTLGYAGVRNGIFSVCQDTRIRLASRKVIRPPMLKSAKGASPSKHDTRRRASGHHAIHGPRSLDESYERLSENELKNSAKKDLERPGSRMGIGRS
jgi:hypothetical protein